MIVRFLFLIFLALFLGANAWLGKQETIGDGGYAFVAVFAAAHLSLAGMWLCKPFTRPHSAFWIVILAVAARALWFPFVVSDDVNRYVWEGRIQNHGHNPFRLAPDAEELIPLRDANWEGINHKHLPSVYPPAAQIVFRLCSSIYADGRCHRLLFTLFDLGTLIVLIRLARLYSLPMRHLLLYALNPIVLLYIAGEGHLDAVPAFFIMAAILARKRQREGFAFFLLGLGGMFKLVPLLLVPLFLKRRNISKVWLCFLPFLLVIPYVIDGTDITRTSRLFAGTFYYNASLFSMVSLFLSNYTASQVCWLAFLLILGLIVLLVPDLMRSCYLAVGALLLCSPIVHPWYFCLLAPFLAFHGSWPWLLLMMTACASFATRIHRIDTGEWIDFPLARCVEYIPMALVWVWVFLKGRETGPERFPRVQNVSVIIPSLDEGETLSHAIESIRRQSLKPLEILVVDGGSKDDTRDRVEVFSDVSFIIAAPGRGGQIAEGVRRARGDLVLIVHADSRLAPDAMERMMSRLSAEPAAAGGAFGAAYDSALRKHAFIAFLDNLRARLLGVSFGNQAQFFRKACLKDGFPPYRFMEDVELSFRMKEAGAVVFVPGGVVNLPRRWHEMGFLKNSLLVLKLVAVFVVRRRLGLVRGDLNGFYTRYYGNRGSG
ncbi:MAG: glycosyltransferase [Planctomycetota bacterium]